MNHLAQELRDDPELAEKLLSDAGKVGLAYLAAQVRGLTLENEKMNSQIANAHAKNDRLERTVEALTEKCRQLQSKTNSRIEILQNQINQNKPAAGRG